MNNQRSNPELTIGGVHYKSAGSTHYKRGRERLREMDLEAYRKLSAGCNGLLRTLRTQLRDIQAKKKRGGLYHAWRLVYQGQRIALENAITDLELVIERAHYHIKFQRAQSAPLRPDNS